MAEKMVVMMVVMKAVQKRMAGKLVLAPELNHVLLDGWMDIE